MRYRIPTALAVLALPLLAACNKSPSGPDMKWAFPDSISYYPGLHVNLARMSKTASGVFYWDSVAGTGTEGAQQGDRVTVKYAVWFPDGTLLDVNQTGSFQIRLLPDSVITGWVDGLTGAVVGTTRQLVIPPALAYGANGSLNVPPYTTLVFLITIVNITHVGASSAVASVSAPPAALPELTDAIAGAFARASRASP